MTRAQKAAAILVAMGKPSASKLLKFFKQDELKALVEGARLLRTISQADLEKIVAEFEAEFTEGAGLLNSSDRMDTIINESLTPEEVNALMGVEPAEGGAGRPPAGLAGHREARSGSARHVPDGGASADRGTRAVETVAVGRGERAADARQGCAQRSRQAHDVDGGHTGGRDRHHRGATAWAASRRKRDARYVCRPDPRRQRAQRDGQGQARRGHAGPRTFGRT